MSRIVRHQRSAHRLDLQINLLAEQEATEQNRLCGCSAKAGNSAARPRRLERTHPAEILQQIEKQLNRKIRVAAAESKSALTPAKEELKQHE